MIPPNTTTIVSFLSYANTATGNWFWLFAWIAIFAIMFGNLKINNTFADSFAASSFFSGMIGIFLGLMQLINDYVTLVSIIMTIIGAVFLLWNKKTEA